MSHRSTDPSFARFRTRVSRPVGRTDTPRPVASPHRFSGGGFGGCLVTLVERDAVEPVAEALLERYLARYPGKRALARTFVAAPERGVRIE